MANNYAQGTIYPFLPAEYITDEELDTLSECGFTYDSWNDGMLYFYTEENVEELAIEVFQTILRKLPVEIFPYITFEAALTCSKMRPGEFGGIAWFITRDSVDYTGTSNWLFEKTKALRTT